MCIFPALLNLFSLHNPPVLLPFLDQFSFCRQTYQSVKPVSLNLINTSLSLTLTSSFESQRID